MQSALARRSRRASALRAGALALALHSGAGAQTILRVDAASPGGDGSSWPSAYASLRDALAAAPAASEIWVAAGVYRPDAGTGAVAGDPDARFALPADVSLFGGFSGSETARGQRDWRRNRTVLSGDLGADDEPSCFVGGNSAVVVESRGSAASALDGFEIRGGAVGVLLRWQTNAAPAQTRLANLVIRRNEIGVVIDGATATLSNLLVVDNGVPADVPGGGVRVLAGSPVLVNATLARNGLFGVESAAAVSLRNAIVWGQPLELAAAEVTPGSFDVSFSCVQGGFAGTGNLDCDPLFFDADGADGIAGSADDDYRPRAGSPAIDAGSNAAVADGADLDGLSRRVDDPTTADSGAGSAPIVDLGAYEFDDRDGDAISGGGDNCPFVANPGQTDANANGRGDACECGDANDDGLVAAADVAALRAELAGLPPGLSAAGLAKCSVIGAPGSCDLLDRAVLGRALALPPLLPGISQTCSAAVGP